MEEGGLSQWAFTGVVLFGEGSVSWWRCWLESRRCDGVWGGHGVRPAMLRWEIRHSVLG